MKAITGCYRTSNGSHGDRNGLTTIMATTSNQDTTSDHTNADPIGKTPTAWMAGQCHANENSPKSAPNQPRKYTTTIPTNDGGHWNNRAIHPPSMVDTKSGNQDRRHKRQGQRPTLRNAKREIDGRNYIHRRIWYKEQDRRSHIWCNKKWNKTSASRKRYPV